MSPYLPPCHLLNTPISFAQKRTASGKMDTLLQIEQVYLELIQSCCSSNSAFDFVDYRTSFLTLQNLLGGFYIFLVHFDYCNSAQFSVSKVTSNPKLFFLLHVSGPNTFCVSELEEGEGEGETSLYSPGPGLGPSFGLMPLDWLSLPWWGSIQVWTLSRDTRVCSPLSLPSSLMLKSHIFQPSIIESEVKNACCILQLWPLKGR